MVKEKALILSPPSQSGRGLEKRRGRVLIRGDYYSGRGGVLEEKDRRRAGKERLGENLGPLVPLPQTKIKTRILKGDLITQSQGWGKGWAGGHCLLLLQSLPLHPQGILGEWGAGFQLPEPKDNRS